jgi:hypothetical protein
MWAPIASYYINFDYFSQTACINKNKPKLKCNGQCQLMKLAAKQESQKDSPAPASENKLENMGISAHLPAPTACLSSPFAATAALYADLIVSLPPMPVSAIDIPPPRA